MNQPLAALSVIDGWSWGGLAKIQATGTEPVESTVDSAQAPHPGEFGPEVTVEDSFFVRALCRTYMYSPRAFTDIFTQLHACT